MDLDQIDGELGGPMRIATGPAVVVLPAATDLPWRVVAAAVKDKIDFYYHVWLPTGVPLAGVNLTEQVRHAWARHNGLPEGMDLYRLLYMMERYADGIEYDLRNHLGVDMGELFRSRRWRVLVNYIDMLPSNSHKNRLVTLDEEHMEAILSSKQAQSGEYKPSMSDWGQLENMMATLIDAVNRNTETVHATAQGKKKPLRIPNYPRPATAADRVKVKIQKRKHEEMVNMLLPAKREGQVS